MKLHNVFRRPSVGGLLKKSPDADVVKSEPNTDQTKNNQTSSPNSGSSSTFYTECSTCHDASFNILEQANNIAEVTESSFSEEGNHHLGDRSTAKDSETILREFTSGHDASFHVSELENESNTASLHLHDGNEPSPAKDSKTILKEFTSGREKPAFQQPFNPNGEQSPTLQMPFSVVVKRARPLESDDSDAALADNINVVLGASPIKFPTVKDVKDDTELADKIDFLLSTNSSDRHPSNKVELNSSLHDLTLDPITMNESSLVESLSETPGGVSSTAATGTLPPSISQNDYEASSPCFSSSSCLDEGHNRDGQPNTKENSAVVLTELLKSQRDISKAFGELALGMAKLVDEKELNTVAKPRFFQRLRKKKTPLTACEDEEASTGSIARDDGSPMSFQLLGRKNLFSRVPGGDEHASAKSISTKDDGSRLSLRRFRKNYVSLDLGENEHASTNSIATNDDQSSASVISRELSETCAVLDDSKLKRMNMNRVANLIDSLVLRQEEIALEIVSIAADAMRKAEDKESEIQRLQHTLRQLESYVSSKRTSAKRRLSMNSVSTFGSNKVWPKIDEEIEENSIISDCSEDLPPGIPRMIDISHTIVDIEKICEYDDDTASFIPDNLSVRLIM